MPRKRDSHTHLLCIDPGTKVTGWALFEVWDKEKEGVYIQSGIIKENGDSDWFKRLTGMLDRIIEEVIYPLKCEEILIEQPRQFFGTSRGRGAANSGAVEKLSALVFGLWGALYVLDEKCILVPVNKWKGNVPKEVTQKRILTHWGIHFTEWATDDQADAIGLGDWHIRKQLGYTPRKVT